MITWVLEKVVFADGHVRLAEAATARGHSVVWWDDDWLSGKRPPDFGDSFVVFSGSLECASSIREKYEWVPGAFCNTDRFTCSNWYDQAQEWLVHETWVASTVSELVGDPASVLDRMNDLEEFFVRPDSPLKPFSGRRMLRDQVSLRALDHGFYYDDIELPIILAPIREIGDEWRLVIAGTDVVAASAYIADGRSEAEASVPQAVLAYGSDIAATIVPPDPVYVMDICSVAEGLRLLELNPFSGADLYNCDRSAVVSAVARIAAI